MLKLDDAKEQSETTKKAKGNQGDGGALIEAAIKLNIPFRTFISMICAQADKAPVISLRRKKALPLKTYLRPKRKYCRKFYG